MIEVSDFHKILADNRENMELNEDVMEKMLILLGKQKEKDKREEFFTNMFNKLNNIVKHDIV